MKKDELQKHIFGTYVTLRRGMAIMATLFPFLLYIAGLFHNIPLQDSMSAYYWATVTQATKECVCTVAPSRDWFTGLLFAISACLYLYKGFTVRENWALNLAAICGVGVALFPMDWPFANETPSIWPWTKMSTHGVCAFGLFFCLAYVMWRRSGDTLHLLPPESNAGRYRNLYYVYGMAMVASPLTAFVLYTFSGFRAYTFFAETAGIWAFALYWWTKSQELSESSATRRALKAEVELPATQGLLGEA